MEDYNKLNINLTQILTNYKNIFNYGAVDYHFENILTLFLMNLK